MWLLGWKPLCGSTLLCRTMVLVPPFRLRETPLWPIPPIMLATTLFLRLWNRLIITVCLVLCIPRMTIRPVARAATWLKAIDLTRLLMQLFRPRSLLLQCVVLRATLPAGRAILLIIN